MMLRLHSASAVACNQIDFAFEASAVPWNLAEVAVHAVYSAHTVWPAE